MRSVVAVVVLLLCVPAIARAQQQAPTGEGVYRQHCAACHEGTLPRMPTREALRAVTPEHIETALSSFTMRREGAPLSAAERRAVAEFLSGRPAGAGLGGAYRAGGNNRYAGAERRMAAGAAYAGAERRLS